MTIAAERDARIDVDGLEAGEYQLYRGLDRVFTEAQSLPTTQGVRNQLGLMVLEMDQALRAFEAGDKAGAIDHHGKMLGHSAAVMRESETLSGKSDQAKAEGARNVAPDVRVLLATLLTTSAIVTGDETLSHEKQPWAKTLEAVADAYKAKRAAEVAAITLAPAGANLSEGPASIEKIVLNAGNFPTRFARQDVQVPKETVWSRREYKNLLIVLEGIKQTSHDRDARREATVALSCLKAVNNREIDMLARMRGRRPAEDAEAAGDVKEYAGRLKEYVAKLQDNAGVSDGLKANLTRFAPPAQSAAHGLQRTLGKGTGMLSRAFRFAVAVAGKLLGQAGAAPIRPAITSQNSEKPHS